MLVRWFKPVVGWNDRTIPTMSDSEPDWGSRRIGQRPSAAAAPVVAAPEPAAPEGRQVRRLNRYTRKEQAERASRAAQIARLKRKCHKLEEEKKEAN